MGWRVGPPSWIAARALGLALAAVPARSETIRVINGQSYYPEGLAWIAGKLYYAEMPRDRIMIWDGKENRQVWTQPGCGPTAVAPSPRATLYIFCHLGQRVVEAGFDGQTLRQTGVDKDGAAIGNPNEAVVDAKGGIYFTVSGDFSPVAPATGKVMHIDAKGTISKLAGSIHYANGLTLAEGGKTLLVGAHLDRQILAYDIGADGSLKARGVYLDLQPYMGATMRRDAWLIGPDVLAFDRAGNLYICEYGGGRVLVFSGQKLLKSIALASRFVNSLAFSDKDNVLFAAGADSNSEPSLPGKVYEIADPLK
jgi:gluconolactonase